MRAANEAHPPPIPSSEHVRRLVEANRVEDARRFVEERLAQGDANLENWANLLRPPQVTTSSYRPRRDFGADHAWLRENRYIFLGRWVALRGWTSA
jgi:hypothetical protein